MTKKSTWEMTLEIGRQYQTRAGLLISAWSEEHIAWLLDRWQFKRPADKDQILVFRAWLSDCMTYRRSHGLWDSKVFVFRPWLLQMLHGSTVMADIIQPPQPQSRPQPRDKIIVLKQRPSATCKKFVWIDEYVTYDVTDAISAKLDAFRERHNDRTS